MPRIIGRNKPLRVVVVDDRGLIFSDDYRSGWVKGFQGLGCDVEVVDISQLRRVPQARSAYSTTIPRGAPKMAAQGIVKKRPDFVFAHHGTAASHPSFLEYVRRYGIRTAAYLCDEPYETGNTASFSPRFDFVFSMDPCTVDAHREARGGRSGVFYLPPGVDTGHFKLVEYGDREEMVPVRFLGNPMLDPRQDYIKPIERMIEGADIRGYPRKLGARKVSARKGDDKWVPLSEHPSFYAGCVIGLNVYRNPAITEECFKRRVLGRSGSLPVPRGLTLAKKLPARPGTGFWNDFNLPASHVNPRFLEMSACGTLTISDDTREEHRRLFPMAPVAENPEHMLELVMYYLDHQDEAEQLGRACSYRISRRHTYQHRAAEVLIRVGLMESESDNLPSFLGEPRDWLTPQPSTQPGGKLSLGPTGRSGRWSPAFGMSSISMSGNPSEASSIDVPLPWQS